LNAAPSIVQNFAPIGRRSSEITRGKKKKTRQNISPLRKLSLPGGLISAAVKLLLLLTVVLLVFKYFARFLTTLKFILVYNKSWYGNELIYARSVM